MKTELGLSIAAPTVTQQDVDRVCEMLARIGWQRANVLCAALDMDDRTLRAIAEALVRANLPEMAVWDNEERAIA